MSGPSRMRSSAAGLRAPRSTCLKSSRCRPTAACGLLPNCFLAPHNANSSVAAAERVHENTIRALLEELARPVGRALAV